MFKRYIPLLVLPFCSLFAKSSVWKISKGSQSLYIGGTCHVLRTSDYPMPPEFEHAYSLADTLVFEMDPSIAADPEFTSRLSRASTYSDGRSLKTLLSEQTYKKLVEKCEQNNLQNWALMKTVLKFIITSAD